jgi:hypothetical protein
MTKDFIRYRERRYKYQLVESYEVMTCIKGYEFNAQLYSLREDGLLTVLSGYAWDGASGPTIDTPDSMRGSLVHDVFYQMIREAHLPPSEKDNADRELHKICIEDGMDRLRANAWYDGVHLFGASSCEIGSDKKEIYTAPHNRPLGGYEESSTAKIEDSLAI